MGVRTNRKYITGDLQNVSSEVFPIRSFWSSIWMLFCHGQNMSEYVRMVPFFPLFDPRIFAFDLPQKMSESLAPGSRLSEGVIFDVLFLGFLQMLLMIAYVNFIASHIVSLYFVYLIVLFRDVEECILFDFKFFGQVEVKELGGTSLCSTRPRAHSSCNRCYWSQGAGQNGQIQKIQNKDEKGNCYSLFMFVAMLKTGVFNIWVEELRNSGEKNRQRQRNIQQQLRWSKEVTQIANCLGSWEMLECKCWTNICNAILVLNSPWFTMIHSREKSGGLQVYLVWFSLVSTWRRRNRGIPWMPLGPLEWRRETSALCHLKEISHWSCDGLSWNKSQRKIPKNTTNVKEVTFLAAL